MLNSVAMFSVRDPVLEWGDNRRWMDRWDAAGCRRSWAVRREDPCKEEGDHLVDKDLVSPCFIYPIVFYR